MSALVAEKFYNLDWVSPFLKGIYRQNSNEITFGWYNNLVVIKTGCEIEIMKT